MDADYRVLTPENVPLEYDVAGLGSRATAAIIDLFIVWASYAALTAGEVYFVANLTPQIVSANPLLSRSLGYVMVIGFALTLFWVWWGYFLMFDMLWNGQTPGKRLTHLRVVRQNGQ